MQSGPDIKSWADSVENWSYLRNIPFERLFGMSFNQAAADTGFQEGVLGLGWKWTLLPKPQTNLGFGGGREGLPPSPPQTSF